MHDNYFVTLPTSQYNKSAKTDKKNKSFKQYNLLQCQSSYSPLGSFSNYLKRITEFCQKREMGHGQ